jgi:hypothetical protein
MSNTLSQRTFKEKYQRLLELQKREGGVAEAESRAQDNAGEI